jgi:hypothetical protein
MAREMPSSETFAAESPSQDLRLLWTKDGILTLSLDGGDVGQYSTLGAAETDRLITELQRARSEAFGEPPLTAAVIEVIERGRATDDTLGGSLLLPNEVRINGHPVPTCDGGVKIHEMKIPGGKDIARVTFTLPARRIIVAAEGDLGRPGL